MTRILAIDPSLNCTGYAVVDVDSGQRLTLVTYGFIQVKKSDNTEQRLKLIYDTLQAVVVTHKPTTWVAESPFMYRNTKTLVQLAHTHGAILLLAGQHNQLIHYYSPMTIKTTVLGGAKTMNTDGTRKTSSQWKVEVATAVFAIFNQNLFTTPYTDDVTDALSVAITWVTKQGQGCLGEELKPPKKSKKKIKADASKS